MSERELTASLTNWKKTHDCGTLRKDHAGLEVTLNGWVHKRRDHGGLIFVDLRDRSGLVQVVFDPQTAPEAFAAAERLRSENVISITGTVRERLPGMENPALDTGEIEVSASSLVTLSEAKTPPFPIFNSAGSGEVDEALRLKYRYLDLRRPELKKNMEFRHRVAKSVRDFLDSRGFYEIETPMLTRSTPEGARDFLVPSRLRPGEFYALPQSPQLFKQLLMVGGLERYFQIVRCFRDEDLRADRQPEFTQIDIEMSFVDREDVMSLTEQMLSYVFRETLGIELEVPFTRLTYDEAMSRYGSDKPDARFGMELIDLTDLLAQSGFRVFVDTAGSGGKIKAIVAPGCGGYSRRELDELVDLAGDFGAKGLVWMVVSDQGVKCPVAKFMSDGEIASILDRTRASAGDLILVVADRQRSAEAVLGQLRLTMGKRLGLIDNSRYELLWVTEFPLMEFDPEEGRNVAVHHPFTSPLDEDLRLLDSNPLAARSKSYDVVLNGVELGGGSIRIHRRDVQQKMFRALGFSDEEAQEKFGFLLEAFEYGTPPHGGIAIGLDRMVMLMAGGETIRDFIAFPKTQKGTCLMTMAPAPVSDSQLQELYIRLAPEIAVRNK